MRAVVVVLAGLFALLSAGGAQAFCGFYVSGGGAKLFNNATVVVMMREGTRTVLSMQNNYEGPPKDFAMVIPVPVVLQKENVRTLERRVFDRVDRLAAPRLVEYWELDPCAPSYGYAFDAQAALPMAAVQESAAGGGYQVKIEAQFTVGEYEIVVLSAGDSTGLDQWLKDHGYNIPDGAEPVLRPYVTQGMKFFVAKVDVDKVRRVDGHAMLSPLRFHYEALDFSLPVRLGLLNSSGTQDLIVHVLARGQRYEVANYPSVTIPTNLELLPEAKAQFGQFYVALFDETLKKHPGAVITEYAWSSGKCDPCPGPTLSPGDLITLGLDALPSFEDADERRAVMAPQQFVLTRLHARYSKSSLGQDLVFRAAPPIAGGRETMSPDGDNERGAQPSSQNQFQGRYIIRHPWEGPVECDDPVRGRWGPPPYGQSRPLAAQNLAFVARDQVEMKSLLAKTEAEQFAVLRNEPVAVEPAPPPKNPPSSGCAGCRVGVRSPPLPGVATALALAGAWFLRRRRGVDDTPRGEGRLNCETR